MTTVRVIVKDIEGHEISAGVDDAGTIYVVLNPNLPNPYATFADLMTDLVGRLPDVCTYEYSPQLQMAS